MNIIYKILSLSLCFVFTLVAGIASSDSLAIARLLEANQLQDDKIEKLNSELNTLQEDVKFISELAKVTQDPYSFLVDIGLFLGAFFLFAVFLWKILVWLEPKWFTKFIQRLVEKYEETNVLKSGKNIVVLMPQKAGEGRFIHSFFGNKEFEKVTYINEVTEACTLQDSVDLFFAYNEYGGLDQEVLENFLKSHPTSYLFYFGAPGSWNFNHSLELNKRINLANSRAQIYGNLLSTLKLQDLTTPKIIL